MEPVFLAIWPIDHQRKLVRAWADKKARCVAVAERLRAVAGIFKAPIAGLMFVIEVLMLDLTMKSLPPLLTTSITSVCVSYAIYGTDAMFNFSLDKEFSIDIIPACVFLGIFCGFLSLYFTRTMNWFERIFARLKSRWAKFALGAVVLGMLIYFSPLGTLLRMVSPRPKDRHH